MKAVENNVSQEAPSRIEKRKKDSARLIWDSKPKRAPNPKDIEFQTAEVVIPNPAVDQTRLSPFLTDLSKGTIDRSGMNRLVWGDNLLAMQALLASGYQEKIELIYIDPPFWTGENYFLNVRVDGESVTRSPSVIERMAYKDVWEGGIDSYLDMLYPRLQLMKRLLSDSGSIYVHSDWHMGHYIKVLMDEVFGSEHFINEIVWERSKTRSSISRKFKDVHDTILIYSKSQDYFFEIQWKQLSDASKRLYANTDETGSYQLVPLLVSGKRNGETGMPWKGIDPNRLGRSGMHWIN